MTIVKNYDTLSIRKSKKSLILIIRRAKGEDNMARLYNNFDFTGEVLVPNDDNRVYVKNEPFSSGWRKDEVNLGVKESDANGMFLRTEALIPPNDDWQMRRPSKIRGENLEFRFSERNNTDIIKNAANFIKFELDLETDEDAKSRRRELYWKIFNIKERANTDKEEADDKDKLLEYGKEYKELLKNYHEFVHEYDFINAIHENLDVIKENKIRATGNVEKVAWDGRQFTNYEPRRIELVPEDEKSRLESRMHIFFNRDAIDDSMYEDTGKIYINGYLSNYDNQSKKDMFFPQRFVINGNVLDDKIVDYYKSMFDVRGDDFYRSHWEVHVYRGVEREEFSEKHLTESQRTAVELGILTLEECRPEGGDISGGNIDELILETPILKDGYENGAIKTPMDERTFSDLISRGNNQQASSGGSNDDRDYIPIREREGNEDNSEEPEKEEETLDDILSDMF